MDKYSDRIRQRAIKTLEAYRAKQQALKVIQIKNLELLHNMRDHLARGVALFEPPDRDRQDRYLADLEREIAENRRNYEIARKLGSDFENGLRDNYPLRSDTKIETPLYLPAGEYRMRIAKLVYFNIQEISPNDPVIPLVEIDYYDVAFDKWQDIYGFRWLVGFLQATNTLFVKGDGFAPDY